MAIITSVTTYNGALLTDPPLSVLGHRQARETAEFLGKITNSDNSINDNISVDNILVSPYLRVIQTACPTSTVLKVPICIENGLSEAHAYKSGDVLPSPQERFAYFPHIDPNHTSLLNIQPTPGYNCPLTGYPCEAFAGRYCQRMEQFAMRLERLYFGKNVILFSHAASVALVAALLRCSMRTLKFAPCGIYHLQRVNDGPWTLVRNGESNGGYVKENSPTTFPWGFSEKHFIEEEEGKKYFGSSEGIDLDYFVQKEESKM